MTDKQKADSKNWLKNNIAKPEYKDTVKKVLPYLAPGGLGGSLNSPVGVEKLEPIVNNPEQFNIGIDNKKIPQPGPTDGTDKKIKNTQPTPLVQPKQKDSSPGILDKIGNWFSDTFGSSTKPAPVKKVNKTVLAPTIQGNRKIKPAYTIPNIAAPVDNGDGTVTWNGQVYDKDFDADKLEKDMKRINTAPTAPVKKVVLPSIGSGQGGAVSGGKDKGKDGGVLGSPGEIGELPWDGGVSGSSSKGKSTDKPGDGTITGPEIGIKGTTGTTTGTSDGTITGPEIGIKGQTGTQSQTISKDLTTTKSGTNQLVKTMPPPPPPPIVVPDNKNVTYRKYDPKTDKDIIYKGRKAPKNVVDFKAIKTGVGGMADRLRLK